MLTHQPSRICQSSQPPSDGISLPIKSHNLALPTASIGATAGVDRREHGLAGGLLTAGQQIGAAVGLALLPTRDKPG
ncbi:MAG TPA: hypothetical protein VIZ18_19530 [Ktedonobacteraceae bacterium]